MPPVLPICTSCDDHYAPYCGVMITSLLANCRPDTDIHVHILDGGISEENRANMESLKSIRDFELHFHTMSNEDFHGLKMETWPVSANYRFKVASVLGDISRILYLDCDIVILEDPVDLITNFPEDAWCCGVPDAMSARNKKRLGLTGYAPYINSGVLVIDLDAWRANNIEEKMLEYAREHTDILKYQDQDVINVAMRDHVHFLPLRWNSQYLDTRYTPRNSKLYYESFHKPAIIHYVTSEKPWLPLSAAPRKKYFYRYLAMTPWNEELKADRKAQLKTKAPYARRWKRIVKNSVHIHTKEGSRFVRLFGLTFMHDIPGFE